MSHSDNEPDFATIRELGRLLRAKKISAVELAQHVLLRLGAQGPRYNALAELTGDRALAQARRADRRIARGDTASPLLGIPYGAKDLFATKGIPTRWGAPPLGEQVFDYDATAIARLERAGAALSGKLAMIELAGGGSYGSPSASLHGPGLNPWNTGHWSGGSSSGSAIVVAAGLLPFALASETWGSIVTPAAYCGVTGLRPTWGRVSRYGAMELAWSMDKVGAMARTAEDCGLVLQAIAGHDPKDWTTSKNAFKFSARRRKRAYRLGVLPADFSDNPALQTAFQNALHIFEKGGMRVRAITLPNYAYEMTAVPLLHGETAAALGDFIRSGLVEQLADPVQIAGLKASLELRAEDYARARRTREQLVPEVLARFDEVDALVTPAVMQQAPSIDANLKAVFPKRGGYGALGALCGIPSLTLPMGMHSGLPLAISIIGNRFEENTILQIGMAFQQATDWHTRRPPVERLFQN